MSAIKIESNSTVEFDNVIMDDIICYFGSCIGGGLLILNSQGAIKSSSFHLINSYNSGGAIAIINPNGNITIFKTNITNCLSSDGSGGGLAFTTDL